MRKKLISVRVDPKIHKIAKELGLNISKTCENSLKQQIQQAIASDSTAENILTPEGSLKDKEWWAEQDLNLRPQPRKGCILTN
jgi:hypothetical protein